jgi:hypothetical protein
VHAREPTSPQEKGCFLSDAKEICFVTKHYLWGVAYESVAAAAVLPLAASIIRSFRGIPSRSYPAPSVPLKQHISTVVESEIECRRNIPGKVANKFPIQICRLFL